MAMPLFKFKAILKIGEKLNDNVLSEAYNHTDAQNFRTIYKAFIKGLVSTKIKNFKSKTPGQEIIFIFFSLIMVGTQF